MASLLLIWAACSKSPCFLQGCDNSESYNLFPLVGRIISWLESKLKKNSPLNRNIEKVISFVQCCWPSWLLRSAFGCFTVSWLMSCSQHLIIEVNPRYNSGTKEEVWSLLPGTRKGELVRTLGACDRYSNQLRQIGGINWFLWANPGMVRIWFHVGLAASWLLVVLGVSSQLPQPRGEGSLLPAPI